MARQFLVLALFVLVLDGLHSATSDPVTAKIAAAVESVVPSGAPSGPSKSNSASSPGSAASGPDSEIGTIDGAGDAAAEEAPVGGPVSADAFSNVPSTGEAASPTGAKASAATTLQVSAVAGVAAVAGFFF